MFQKDILHAWKQNGRQPTRQIKLLIGNDHLPHMCPTASSEQPWIGPLLCGACFASLGSGWTRSQHRSIVARPSCQVDGDLPFHIARAHKKTATPVASCLVLGAHSLGMTRWYSERNDEPNPCWMSPWQWHFNILRWNELNFFGESMEMISS